MSERPARIGTWREPVDYDQQERGAELPFWPCAQCKDLPMPYEGRFCYCSFGPGREHFVGCRATGEVWRIRLPVMPPSVRKRNSKPRPRLQIAEQPGDAETLAQFRMEIFGKDQRT